GERAVSAMSFSSATTRPQPEVEASGGERTASAPVGRGGSPPMRNASNAPGSAPSPTGAVAQAGSTDPAAAIGQPSWLPRVLHPRPRRPAGSGAKDVTASAA